MSMFEQEKNRNGGMGIALGLTLCGLALFAWIDRIYPQVTFAPLVGALLLLGLALCFPPRVIFAAFVVIFMYVAYNLAQTTAQGWELMETRVRFAIRVSTFLVAGIIALLASHFRCSLAAMLAQTKELLSRLPVGVVLSDIDGRIVWANEASGRHLGSRPQEGRLWEEVMPAYGHPIDYRLLFSNANDESLIDEAFPEHSVHIVRLKAVRNPLMVTVIYSAKSDQRD